MAKIGLSKPYFAKYANDGTTVTYSGGALLGKAVELSIELEGSDDNNLYADNGIAESENTFAGGTVTVTTDELEATTMLSVLGVTEEAITTTGLTTTDPKWYTWDDDQDTPYLGFAAIAKIMHNGLTKYQAIVLPKIKFSNPSDTFTTQGETIEWGTPEISGNIHRSDAVKSPWKKISSALDSEDDAEAVIRDFFGIAA
jgi:phi13 family phage major tail protein